MTSWILQKNKKCNYTVEKIVDKKGICKLPGNINHLCCRKFPAFKFEQVLAKKLAQLP